MLDFIEKGALNEVPQTIKVAFKPKPSILFKQTTFSEKH